MRRLAAALSLALGGAAHAAIITVDSNGDGLPAGICTLRAAVLAANTGAFVGSCTAGNGANTIRFAPGISAIELSNGELLVSSAQPLTLDGGASQVTVRRAAAAAPFRIINVTSAIPLNLNRITISGGRTGATNGWGAGINSAGSVALVNSTISGNASTAASSGGGGISAVGAVTLTDSDVTGNSTAGPNSPGGGINSNGSVSLTRSLVSGNSTAGDGSRGGGIRTATAVTLADNSVVLGNGTTGTFASGGGIEADSVTMTNSSVSGNTVRGNRSPGGGVNASTVTLANSAVSNNIISGTVGPYDEHAAGGGIYALDGVTLSSSTVSGNRAEGANDIGGGIWTMFNVDLVNSTVTGNTSHGDGGAFHAHTATLFNSTVAFNSTRKYGECGGILLWERSDPALYGRNSLDMRSSIVFGNSSQTVGNVCLGSTDGTGLNITGSRNLIGTTTAPVSTPFDTLNCDPALSALASNGGLTQTLRLGPQSCAINAGSNPAGLPFDQRGSGFPRVVGANADIGAYEFRDVIFVNGFD